MADHWKEMEKGSMTKIKLCGLKRSEDVEMANEFLPDYVGFVFARSGMACKRGLAPANKVGVIDSDYRGELMIALHNHGTEPQTVSDGERVAQLILLPVLTPVYLEADALDETERGTGGFGSTGK